MENCDSNDVGTPKPHNTEIKINKTFYITKDGVKTTKDFPVSPRSTNLRYMNAS